MSSIFRVTAVIALVACVFVWAQPSFASISYSVGDTGELQFPGLVTPPANAPWGPNGYPGDTVQIFGTAGSLPGAGVYDLVVGTLHWVIDYTYGGTATDPNDWSNLSFVVAPLNRLIDFDMGAASGSISQQGDLFVTFDNDYLSLDAGSTSTFYVPGFQIDVTPLGLAEVGGSDFSGGNPWTQPDRDVLARFVVTELAVPEPSMITVFSLYSLGGGAIAAIGWWRRRKASK